MPALAILPQPRDIPLPLPGDAGLLQALLVVVFLAHILFVNLMVGGSLIAFWLEATGRRRPERDALALAVSRTITVNKSLAVVLGVGPLLTINVLYTVFFYSANTLTGFAWAGLVPLVTAAFLAAYAYKYSWHRLAAAKGWHLALGGLAGLLFLTIPFVFLANINLMLFPERWGQVHGFLSAVLLPNVVPRYLHFVLACVSVTSLFLLFWFTRAGYAVETTLPGFTRASLRRLFYRLALMATGGQVAAGPLVLLTLPRFALSGLLYAAIGLGASLALTAIALMARELRLPDRAIGRHYLAIVALIAATAGCMVYGRHVYRESAVGPYRLEMASRTADYGWNAAAARWREARGVGLDTRPLGERIFTDACASCHAIDRVLVGPSLQEIARIYAGNPGGIARWADAPGRKRPGFQQMPAFRLGSEKLIAVAEYMLKLGEGQAPAPSAPPATVPATSPAKAPAPTPAGGG